ncbi:Uncharacterised protein [Mycobacteroides abscessus subsp. abscessus]|nr:Uncharacterised protein [Mycobacteroides abscessus subsp. abscessus]
MRTGALARTASGAASRPSSAQGVRSTSSSVITNGISSSTRCSVRVRASPSLTASVVFPVAVSVGMSRRLFATSTALEKAPTPTASATPTQSMRSACTNCVPSTAINPKKTKTAISPNPL